MTTEDDIANVIARGEAARIEIDAHHANALAYVSMTRRRREGLSTAPRCCNCGGPWHRATGHAFTDTAVLCHRCAGRFLAWVVRHTGGKGARRQRMQRPPDALGFYAAAATSVRA